MPNQPLINRLEKALNDQLFDVYFQPQVDLQTHQIIGAEALLRWKRGNETGIEPEVFMPIVESTELIHHLGAWVMQEACRACKAWQKPDALITVSVNVSALQLARSGFYSMVVDALEQNDLSPALLVIEITEHFLVTETPMVIQQLDALKRLGVALHIDDFGTGYSNIVYLSQLSIDALKLDKRFIAQIDQLNVHQVIVTAMISMAKALGIKVVAEGIERECERDFLASLHCDYGQGFLWSPAVTGSAFLAMINHYHLIKVNPI